MRLDDLAVEVQLATGRLLATPAFAPTGISARAVALRRREIGIRIALGDVPGERLRFVLGSLPPRRGVGLEPAAVLRQE